jgi:hypothetical protein
MRTIDEFNAAADAHIRRMWIFMGTSIAGLFAMWLIPVVIREAAPETVRNRLGDVGFEILNFSLMAGGMVVFLAGAWLGYRRGGRDPLLLCPPCGTMLVERRYIVIATRNCIRCGRRVLAEPDS